MAEADFEEPDINENPNNNEPTVDPDQEEENAINEIGGESGTTNTATGGGVGADGTSKLNLSEKAGLDQVGKEAGTSGPITDAVAEDASKAEPTTEDGKKVKSYWEKAKDTFDKAKEKLTENKGNLMKLAGFAFIFFLAYEANKSLQDTADAMTGCYQQQACGQMAKPVKVGCSQTQCTCPLTSPPCASPGCGGSNCVNYVWTKYTPLQVLANVPAMLADPLINSATSSLKTILTYGAIFVGVVALAYVAFKILGRIGEKHEGEEGRGERIVYEESPPPYTEKFRMCNLRYRDF